MKFFNLFNKNIPKSNSLYAKLSGIENPSFTVNSRFEKELEIVFNHLILNGKFSGNYDEFVSRGIRIESAAEFCEFIPTIFCKEIFPQTKFAEGYLVRCFDGKTIRETYENNIFFKCIEKRCHQFFKVNSNVEIYKQVATCSVEYQFLCLEIEKGFEAKDYRLTEKTIY